MCCNSLDYQFEPYKAFFQVVESIEVQIRNRLHRFVMLCLAEAFFNEDFSRKRVEVKEPFRTGRFRPGTGIDIATERPLIAFHVIAVVASKDPI